MLFDYTNRSSRWNHPVVSAKQGWRYAWRHHEFLWRVIWSLAGAVLILGTTFFEKKFINNSKNCSTLKRKVKMNRILKHLSTISLTILLFLGQGFSGELLIGFGSCLHQDLPQPIWKEIKAQHPKVFIMLGDNVYGDTYGNIHSLEMLY